MLTLDAGKPVIVHISLKKMFTKFENLPTALKVVKIALGVEDNMQFLMTSTGAVYEVQEITEGAYYVRVPMYTCAH